MQKEGYKIVQKLVSSEEGLLAQKYQKIKFSVQKEGGVPTFHHAALNLNELNSDLQQIILGMKIGEKWIIQGKVIKDLDSQQKKITIQLLEGGEIIDHRSTLEQAEALKNEGNDFIKAKKYNEAINKYELAFKKIEYDANPKAQDLKLSLFSNLALATLNLSQYENCLKWCNSHLEETLDSNLKIIYRKASAFKGLRNWSEAKKNIDFGIRQSEKDLDSLNNFKTLLIQLQKDQKQQNSKQKAIYGKMFG